MILTIMWLNQDTTRLNSEADYVEETVEDVQLHINILSAKNVVKDTH